MTRWYDRTCLKFKNTYFKEVPLNTRTAFDQIIVRVTGTSVTNFVTFKITAAVLLQAISYCATEATFLLCRRGQRLPQLACDKIDKFASCSDSLA